MQITAHLADLLCFYRIAASIIVLIFIPNPIAPWIFGSALLTDLIDGWCFRHFTLRNPHWIPWNPLAISADQLGDLSLILCGVFYVGFYGFNLHCIELIIIDLSILAGAWALTVVPSLFPRRYDLAYTVCLTILTHLACLLMLLSTIGVWYTNRYLLDYDWILCAGLNVAIFYLIFILIGDKKRLIRRPHH